LGRCQVGPCELRAIREEGCYGEPMDPLRDLANGIVGLRPKSWRREAAYWLVSYAVAAATFQLPPL